MLCIANTCIWHIGETSTFTFWAPGQPHSHHKRRFILDSVSDEDCVLLKYSDSGHWHDYPCQKLDPLGIVKEHFPYVCEYGKSIKLVMTIEIPPTISSELVNIYIQFLTFKVRLEPRPRLPLLQCRHLQQKSLPLLFQTRLVFLPCELDMYFNFQLINMSLR